LQGVVLETYGGGNAPTLNWFLNLIQKAIDKNIFIVNVSQCISGSVLLGHYETSSKLKQMGIVDGKDITTESAVAKLIYLIGENIPQKEFKVLFETSLRGEMN
ncbi:MAG: L-asparaginase 1, partial [Flavobacteriaceae bacterium]|nr:L-asparaginase 1 [Flavobacteriaceae bacterium]